MSADQTGGIWLTELPPTRGHNRALIIVVIAMVIGFAAVAPISSRPMVELNAFFPSLDAIVFVTDLVTAALLFGQFHISRSRAVLALAIGYLFTALIVVPHALTFAGAFTPTGLLGANIQTGSWLFIFWHLGFSAALLAYALLRSQRQAADVSASTFAVVGWSLLFVVALVGALTWLSTAGASLLPPIIVDRTRMSPIVIYPISFTILISAAALGVLAINRQRSVLDQWLIVVSLAAILELVFSGLLPTVRFSAGFYAGRAFSLLTSSIVLIALVAETTRLYVRLARTNIMLQRERDSRLMNLEALTASIAHEIRQPLTAIIAFTQAALLYLKRNPPDVEPAISTLDEVVETSHRTDQIFDNMRALFGRAEVTKQPVDMNELLLEVLRNLESDLVRHNIITRVELTSPLPPVNGSKSQLQEVFINLAYNAMEAMASTAGQRLLKFGTESHGKTVSVVVEDSGPGFGNVEPASTFEAFVTTKPLGMGLGLAICRQIIDRHVGRISASQKSPHGAVFRIDLPAASAT
jgi:signal transduction histidine kinase